MYVRPISKNLLNQKIRWFRSKINPTTEKGFEIKNIRVDSNAMSFMDNGLIIQSGLGNWRVMWDAHWSTPLPNGQSFAVGDTFKFNQYPYVMVIRNVRPCWTEGTTKLHHIEIWCD